MTDDLIFQELPPGRYKGMVEKVRYSFKAATHIVITYKVDTPHGEVRRIVERLPINAPACGSLYFQTVIGMGRVEEILRTKGLSLALRPPAASGLCRACSRAVSSASSPGTGGRPGSTAPSWTASKLSTETTRRGLRSASGGG